MARFLAIPRDWGNRHEEILCHRNAGRLYQRVHSDGQEVMTSWLLSYPYSFFVG